MTRPLQFAVVAFLGAAGVPASSAQQPADSAWVARQVMIPARDGVRLSTFIVSPRQSSAPLPLLLMRTPYGAAGPVSGFPGPFLYLARDGYVFVFQDIRGRGGSEGEYLMNRPFRSDSSGVDEATDTYDTIEWLVKNVPGTVARVGGLGISYP
ncbi:MAG TPA: CocE/NonD family hydrolase, partial [Gemmatimonadales bacterium]|nr:CocE/NonD family hydrolase [Gemmatimonadales bacterium]